MLSCINFGLKVRWHFYTFLRFIWILQCKVIDSGDPVCWDIRRSYQIVSPDHSCDHSHTLSYSFALPIRYTSVVYHLHWHWGVSPLLFLLIICIILIIHLVYPIVLGDYISCLPSSLTLRFYPIVLVILTLAEAKLDWDWTGLDWTELSGYNCLLFSVKYKGLYSFLKATKVLI